MSDESSIDGLNLFNPAMKAIYKLGGGNLSSNIEDSQKTKNVLNEESFITSKIYEKSSIYSESSSLLSSPTITPKTAIRHAKSTPKMISSEIKNISEIKIDDDRYSREEQ